MTKWNDSAWMELEQVIAKVDHLGISVQKNKSGVIVMDAGVKASGGLEAGLAMAKIGMAGLGYAGLVLEPVYGIPWLNVVTISDQPTGACFLSQAAHWQVQVGDFRAMGSGPACLRNKDLEPGKEIGYDESSAHAVLVLETRDLPDEKACLHLAEKCRVDPDCLGLVIAPTSCLSGSAQIAARSIETGLHKVQQLGFDLHKVKNGTGKCPIAPPTGDDKCSLGKTNDVVLFGCQVWLSVQDVPDSELEALVQKIPSSTSPSYGEPFLDLLKKSGGFYGIDPGLFAPAEITITNLSSGNVFHAGKVDEPRLRKSLFGEYEKK
jgi:methenyltetrahydromethanopterin cyclohydrolase